MKNLYVWAVASLFVSTLACSLAQQTPQPVQVEQLAFDIQTATPTLALLLDAPTPTIDPNATATPTATATLSATVVLSPTATVPPTDEPLPTATSPPLPPTATVPPPTVPPAEPLSGGEWDFEAGFNPWINPFGDSCDGSGLANGWSAFTTRDQFGSSCMNQTTWKGNVHSGESAQEITFAFVGNQAGVYKSAPTLPGHQYTVEAWMRREFSPAKVDVALGIDLTGGTNWEAETVQWFPWREDVDDQWARTEETVTATGQSLTVFIKGNHAFPEIGGALRLDSISITDIGTP